MPDVIEKYEATESVSGRMATSLAIVARFARDHAFDGLMIFAVLVGSLNVGLHSRDQILSQERKQSESVALLHAVLAGPLPLAPFRAAPEHVAGDIVKAVLIAPKSIDARLLCRETFQQDILADVALDGSLTAVSPEGRGSEVFSLCRRALTQTPVPRP